MINSEKFSFVTIDRGSRIPTKLMVDLLEERITGILVKGFLNSSEVETLCSGFLAIPNSDKTKVNDGFTSFPLSFAQFTQMKAAGTISTEDYIQIAGRLLENQQSWFGIDFVSRFCKFLESSEAFESVETIFNTEFQKPMVPFNIRELSPGKGEFIIHCENLFFEEFPDFFKWLQLMNIRDNKLSYFVTLSEPEEGGELCCFDLNWKNVKHRAGKSQLIDIANNPIDIEDHKNVERFHIRPNEGDLLLFAGGNVWHRVEVVQGVKSRITLGGFVAESTETGKYYIWS
jgi:hypothetical protein